MAVGTVKAGLGGALVDVDVAVDARVSGGACAVVHVGAGGRDGRARGSVTARLGVARPSQQLTASTAKTRRAAAPPLDAQILLTNTVVQYKKICKALTSTNIGIRSGGWL